jgi:EAL domain-containing protein (putative c-di-GMP-specific phosphodiesterase class I)
MKNLEKNKIIIQQIKQSGIRLAIDDVCTGYSSLAYLKQLQMDTLKIDRSFISDVPNDEDDTSIVLAILAMAKTLGLHIVAEGVETQVQLDFLKKEHCHCVQGYLFAKPLPIAGIEAMLF